MFAVTEDRDAFDEGEQSEQNMAYCFSGVRVQTFELLT